MRALLTTTLLLAHAFTGAIGCASAIEPDAGVGEADALSHPKPELPPTLMGDARVPQALVDATGPLRPIDAAVMAPRVDAVVPGLDMAMVPPPVDAMQPPPPVDMAMVPPPVDAMVVPPQDPGCPNFAFAPNPPQSLSPFEVIYLSDVRHEMVELFVEGPQGGNPQIMAGRLEGENPYRYIWPMQGFPSGDFTFTFRAGDPLRDLGRCSKTVI